MTRQERFNEVFWGNSVTNHPWKTVVLKIHPPNRFIPEGLILIIVLNGITKIEDFEEASYVLKQQYKNIGLVHSSLN